MIHVIATIELAPGHRDDFLREFHALVPLVRAETGCVEYGPTVDVETPMAPNAPPRDDVVTVVEKWADLEALKAHLAAAHMADYRQRVKPWVRKVDLRVLRPA